MALAVVWIWVAITAKTINMPKPTPMAIWAVMKLRRAWPVAIWW